MAKFKQVPQNFLFRKLMKYWGNMIQNYKDDCRDDDFYHNLMRTFLHRNELYIDMCHYSEKGNDELAELVLEAIMKGHRS